MPWTPLHGLAVTFLFFNDKRRIDLLALTVSATFVDLEPLYYILIGEWLDHRIWHSFAAVLTVYPILVTLGVFAVEHFFEARLRSAYNLLRLRPDLVRHSLRLIYLSSLVGGVSHIFFDMFTHEEMPYVLFPLTYGNPVYLGQASLVVETAVVLLAVFSCFQWWKESRP